MKNISAFTLVFAGYAVNPLTLFAGYGAIPIVYAQNQVSKIRRRMPDSRLGDDAPLVCDHQVMSYLVKPLHAPIMKTLPERQLFC